MPRGRELKPIPLEPHIWVSSGAVKARCIHCGRYSRKHYVLSLGYTITTLPHIYPGNRKNHGKSFIGTPRLRQILHESPRSVKAMQNTTGWSNAQTWSTVINLIKAKMVTRYGAGPLQVFTLNQCGLRALAEDKRRGTI